MPVFAHSRPCRSGRAPPRAASAAAGRRCCAARRHALLQSGPAGAWTGPEEEEAHSSSNGRTGAAAAAPSASAPPGAAAGATPAAPAPAGESEAESPDGAYAVLRGEYSYDKLHAFFSRRPLEVAARFAAFAAAAASVARVWVTQERLPPERRTRGAVLRNALSDLGAATVKCGQTLAERPDLLGEEAAGALKQLQGNNRAFPNARAWRTIAEDLGWEGPLAPGCPFQADRPGPPLLAHLSDEPVAAASLAQVYYARTREGQEIALKVQRPGLLRNIALDMYVLRLALDALRRTWGTVADLSLIADEVGAGVFRELDAHGEAANAAAFAKSLAFLGFVRAPGWLPAYSGPPGTARVLALEWVHGRRLGQLGPAEARRFVDMAVEASVAQLIRTGFVHADPHAGNLLLDDQGRLVFLDFGLMCTVAPDIREAFAAGVCHLLAGDWLALARDFQDCGLVPPAFEARNPATGKHETCTPEFFADGIRKAICGEADGLTRFGALATGLGGASGTFRFLCPPFIILLCRTFLTLEGMAGCVAPDFSIYASALPYAVRRALSPETARGEAVLRATLLTEGGAFRWARLNELLVQLETQGPAAQQAAQEPLALQLASGPAGAAAAAAAAPPPSPPASGPSMGTVTGLLGAVEGAALRRVAFDADSLSLARHLTGAEGRPLRLAGEKSLAALLASWHSERRAAEARTQQQQQQQQQQQRTAEQVANAAKAAARQRAAVRVIALQHLSRLLKAGLPGLLAVAALVLTAVRLLLGAAARAAAALTSDWLARVAARARARRGGFRTWRPAAAAAAAAAVQPAPA